jgi:hypothetical protein
MVEAVVLVQVKVGGSSAVAEAVGEIAGWRRTAWTSSRRWSSRTSRR